MARELWHVLEPIHAVTYFSAESTDTSKAIGLKGFWMGYFAFRASPLGPVGADVVEALFAGFAPTMVQRSIPDAWSFATPATALEARSGAAAAALRRLVPSIEGSAVAALPALRRAVVDAPVAGRPMFAANSGLAWPSDPVARLWQAATTLREHRGDGHVACLTPAVLDGCAAHVLVAACGGVAPEVLRDNRGWTDDEWQAATADLERRGLVDGGAATPQGRSLRRTVEAGTDAAAATAYRGLDNEDLAALGAALRPIADAVAASGVIPFPNPMGLPRARAGATG